MKKKALIKIFVVVFTFVMTFVSVQEVSANTGLSDINKDNLATTYEESFYTFNGENGAPDKHHFIRYNTIKEFVSSSDEYEYLYAYLGPKDHPYTVSVTMGKSFKSSFSGTAKGNIASGSIGVEYSKDTTVSIEQEFTFPGDNQKWYLYQGITTAYYDVLTDEAIYHKNVLSYEPVKVLGMTIAWKIVELDPEWTLDEYTYYEKTGTITELQYWHTMTKDVH